ncbi:N-acetylmuramoyl-L-alanine amidase [Streptomyces sp. NBC_01262]|uniref:N-acetylmuramoyl-L-alanine amidase n=1 Tax=Streptomyces sp. NBC_01262 TaxID=2903803 RepID=UPI002E339454|nr:N-acetylmuramoyl-L-alanine amidase [Streptomyces sp. NBC_01262]
MFSNKSGVLAIVVAALLPTCFAGWLVWDSLRGPGAGGEPQRVLPLPSVSASGSASARTDDANGTAAAGTPTASALPLAGKVVVLDPGHNPTDHEHTAEINRLVDIGTGRKACDTTGTATKAGYAEAAFTLDVVHRARALLTARGATVKLTHDTGGPAFGPCIDERARIGNEAGADAAVSVHADGSAAGDRGFHVILPASVHQGIADTRAIVAPSRRLGTAMKRHFADATGSAPANYLAGGTGLISRSDLGGLNLTTVPKVFIECGNMRDPNDAAELTDPAWRQSAAEGIADGITAFLRGKT